MKKVNLLLIAILINTQLLAQDDVESSNWNYFGEFKTYYTYVQKEKTKSTYRENMSYSSLQMYFDYEKDGFYFSMTPYAYTYFTESGKDVKNANFSRGFQKQDIFFRTLYLSYSINNFTVGAGIIPLSNGFPMQYTSDYYQDGEGLTILSDLDPLALFMQYKINDENRVIVGVGTLDSGIVPTGMYMSDDYKQNSYGAFLTQKITHKKFRVINDFKYVDVKYKGSDAGELYNLGSGVSWDDSEYSGITIYNVVGLSAYKNNSTALKNEWLLNDGVSQSSYEKFSSSFAFDNKTYYGAANLFGARKDFDFFNFDNFINFEWFHTFNDWASANNGTPYNSNCNHIYNIRNNSYFINYGIRISEASTLKFNYTFLEFDETTNLGAPSSTPVEDSYGPQRKNSQIIKLSYSYKF
ncbi:MAG: hypothetical protein U9N42_07260 [Campylobacterota bacterium]|nr:hypothetical protein [Campylobacterota bacterium]